MRILKKVLSSVLLAVAALLLAILLARNIIAGAFIEHYCKEQLGIPVRVNGVHVSHQDVLIGDIGLKDPEWSAEAKDLRIPFAFRKGLRFSVNKLAVKHISLNVTSVSDFRAGVLTIIQRVSSFRRRSSGPGIPQPFFINIEHGRVEINEAPVLTGTADFSFFGSMQGARLSGLNIVSVPQLKLKGNGFVLEAQLEQTDRNRFVLKIGQLEVKDREVKDVQVMFETVLENDRVLIRGVRLGTRESAAFLTGTVDLSDIQGIKLDLAFDRFPFSYLAKVLNPKQDVVFKGDFSGELVLQMKGLSLTSVQGEFRNTSGGLILIRKETSLDFLRRYLDEKAYHTIIDNLKNYSYSEGMMTLTQQDPDLLLQMSFRSEDLGERDFTINFHNVIGRR